MLDITKELNHPRVSQSKLQIRVKCTVHLFVLFLATVGKRKTPPKLIKRKIGTGIFGIPSFKPFGPSLLSNKGFVFVFLVCFWRH